MSIPSYVINSQQPEDVVSASSGPTFSSDSAIYNTTSSFDLPISDSSLMPESSPIVYSQPVIPASESLPLVSSHVSHTHPMVTRSQNGIHKPKHLLSLNVVMCSPSSTGVPVTEPRCVF